MQETSTYKDTSAAQPRPKMATTSKYKPPTIPNTPSTTINKMLEMRCSKEFDNPAKAGVAYFICGVFQAITLVYTQIKAKSQQNVSPLSRVHTYITRAMNDFMPPSSHPYVQSLLAYHWNSASYLQPYV